MSDPSKEGSWAVAGLSGVVGIHASLMHTGHVQFFCRPELPSHREGDRDCGFPGDTARPPGPDVALSAIFPITGEAAWTPIPSPVVHNPFCAGHTHLADGCLVVAGGDKRAHSVASGDIDYVHAPVGTAIGLNSLQIYTPTGATSGHWSIAGTISDNRWYPSCTLLPDGRVFVVSGSLDDQDSEDANLNPTCELLPPLASGPQFLAPLLEAWPYHSYPTTTVLPSGDLFIFARCSGHYLRLGKDASGVERFEIMPGPKLPDGEPAKFYPNSATAVLLPLLPEENYRSDLLIVGGSSQDTYAHWGDSTHEVDAIGRVLRATLHPRGAHAAFAHIGEMNNPRVMPDAVLLPDGTVLVVSGARKGYAGGDAGTGPAVPDYAVKHAELFDPKDGSWRTLAEAKCARLYHSTALLLPDASVLVAGNDHRTARYRTAKEPVPPGTAASPPSPPLKLLEAASAPQLADSFEYEVEIFRPPYLHADVNQSQVTVDRSRLRYGEAFTAGLAGSDRSAGDQLTAALVRPGSVTHNNNMGQRLIGLEILHDNGSEIELKAPPDGNIAPPGFYMLFLIDRGVPARASFVQLLLEPLEGMPAALAGETMALWLRADSGIISDSRNHVASWYDLSGSDNHMYWQPNPQKDGRELRALLLPQGMHGRPCVRLRLASSLNHSGGFQLDMTGGYFTTRGNAFLQGSSSHSLFLVLHAWPGGPLGLGGVFGWGDFESRRDGACVGLRFSRSPQRSGSQIPAQAGMAGFDVYRSGARSGPAGNAEPKNYPKPDCLVPMTRPILLEVHVDAGETTCCVDGEPLGACAAPVGSAGAGPAMLGATGYDARGDGTSERQRSHREYFRGDIAEVITINGPVDEARRRAIRSYLQERYALAAPGTVA